MALPTCSIVHTFHHLCFMPPRDSTVIIICGPTAVGKTTLAIQLAQHFNTKIISADSRQCYKELNIGVAKPSEEELAVVQHYFINSHSIHEEVNVGVFEQYALKAADEIFRRHDIAVMVGGTGLYIKAFTEGIDSIPTTPEEIRHQINNEYLDKGLSWLQNEVKIHDPIFWEQAEKQNPHRLMRALEVHQVTGKSITEFRKGNKVGRPFKTIKIGLQLTKEQLHHNIQARVDKMIEDGLVDEVKSLFPQKNIKALQTVGYRELFDHFEDRSTLDEAILNIKTNTRQYAKRQVTWFKRDKEVVWHTVSPSSLNGLLQSIDKQIKK